MNDFPPEYLGDAVYVAVERGMLKLMTGSHDCPTNTIYLEPEVITRFTNYLDRATEYYKALNAKTDLGELPPIKPPPK